ncbi:MAG TPA: response regulator [Polyangia bacterium]|nr:response regulator [Polyangia bacterium]
MNDDDQPDARAPRVEATFRVSYPSVDQLLVAYSSDLSKGGMFLSTDQFLPVNAVIRINLELGEGSAEIPVICRVVYVRDAAAARAVGKPAGMGIEFLDMTAECLGLIEAYIAERIGEVQEAAAPSLPKRRLSVMIVDDDHGCRTLAAQPFRTRGDYVRIAVDGFEALAQCLKETPDVIVSDVHMPRLDGWQLLRMCRARPTLSSVPFLFLTTLSGEQERLRGYQLGVDDYVGKPFRGKELQARVDRVVDRVQRASHALAEKKTLRGDLASVTMPAVLGFLELERKTGELLVIGPKPAHLFLRDGRLLRVEVDGVVADATSIEVVYDVLSWRTGQFEFAAHEVPGDDLYELSITALLLDHARFSDENNR